MNPNNYCTLCEMSFFSKQTRDRHVKCVHNGDDVESESEEADNESESEDPESETDDENETEEDNTDEEEEENTTGKEIAAVILDAIDQKAKIDEEAWDRCQSIVKAVLDSDGEDG